MTRVAPATKILLTDLCRTIDVSKKDLVVYRDTGLIRARILRVETASEIHFHVARVRETHFSPSCGRWVSSPLKEVTDFLFAIGTEARREHGGGYLFYVRDAGRALIMHPKAKIPSCMY